MKTIAIFGGSGGLGLASAYSLVKDYKIVIGYNNNKDKAESFCKDKNQDGYSVKAIKELIDYFKIEAKDVIVFHDDMDIDFGKIKAKFGGGSAGHNGIESIDKFIGKEYSRVRIGIGHPKKSKKVNNHVLEDFKEDEEEKIKEITENIVKQIPTLIDKKIDLFSSKVNQNLNGI